jgi:hypothetical protein
MTLFHKKILTSFLLLVMILSSCQIESSQPVFPITLPVSTATVSFTSTTFPTAQLSTIIPSITPTTAPDQVRFAVIGDFGSGDVNEASVAKLVNGWNPDLIITVGDDNYPLGGADTIDDHIGQFYSGYIFPYTGKYGNGAEINRFFPTLGNHDWYTSGAQPYLDYFQLPGNERYYDFVWGPVHFFALDSDNNEPDGTDVTSKQAVWLKVALAASTSKWNIVYFHYPPYSSGFHGSIGFMRWPFAAWGADAVLSGHDHSYERFLVDGIPYFVNGLGGAGIYDFKTPLTESKFRFNGTHGAMLISATGTTLNFEFYNHFGVLIDSYSMTKPVVK